MCVRTRHGGKDWHDAGKLANKQHVFDDFIAAAEFLVEKGYTRPDRLAISGGSNGGLLVGAAMTQRPDLFGAVICSVPLLDMVRYHAYGSGKFWVPEYGDPKNIRSTSRGSTPTPPTTTCVRGPATRRS